MCQPRGEGRGFVFLQRMSKWRLQAVAFGYGVKDPPELA
jgi:hypothetical protein